MMDLENRQARGPVACTQKGFTLVELAIIIIIIGISSIPLVDGYISYVNSQKNSNTQTNLQIVVNAMATYSPIRYPCPSDRSLDQSDQNYGVDVCAITGFDISTVPTCPIDGTALGICKVAATRDTEDDGDLTVGNNNEFVLIGGVPLKSGKDNNFTEIAGLTVADTLDGWGRRLTYAVSYTSANTSRLKGFDRYKNGIIRVVDDFGVDTAGTSNDAQFVIISHGVAGRGAYNKNKAYIACDLTSKEGENCDGDTIFVQGIGQYHAAGVSYYDDVLGIKTSQSGDLWAVVNTSDNLPTDHLKGLFSGAVGINTDTPGAGAPSAVMLDVNGSLKAGAVRAEILCNKDGTKCINNNQDTGFFAKKSSGVNACASGQVMKNITYDAGIGGPKVVCETPDINNQGVDVMCPKGYWVRGVLTDGSIICTNGETCPGHSSCCPGGPSC